MIKLCGIQCSLSDNEEENLEKLEKYIRAAASKGARIILAPELFQGHYFCSEVKKDHFSRAKSLGESLSVKRFMALSKELNVFLPVSYFEREGRCYFNSLAAIDRGKLLGNYRKSHIPEGPGYEEREYFSEGDTGFAVWDLGDIKVGTAICWDQWFPEAARIMRLMGADVLLYPTAIGTEPMAPSEDTSMRWKTVMLGHAIANSCPILAANRIGDEGLLSFYGHSFFSNERGEIQAELAPEKEGLVEGIVDLEKLKSYRAEWKFLKHRRPELYSLICKTRD